MTTEYQALSKLIEVMQRMQASYRAQAQAPLPVVGASLSNLLQLQEQAQAPLIVSVLSDLIRLAAELRAGDGSREFYRAKNGEA